MGGMGIKKQRITNMARGRKISVGETSIILYARHSASCAQRGDTSGTVDCRCIRWMQFKDGRRESTGEWTWSKAESVARRKAGGGEEKAPEVEKSTDYKVKQAIDEWIEEREQDGI